MPATQAARASPRIASNAARHRLNVRWRTESPLRSAYVGSCIKRPAETDFRCRATSRNSGPSRRTGAGVRRLRWITRHRIPVKYRGAAILLDHCRGVSSCCTTRWYFWSLR